MRDRLIELIQTSVGGCARHWAEVIADHLLANGVIVLPCKIGATLYDVTEFVEGIDCPDFYELNDNVMYVEKTKGGNILFSYDGVYIEHDDIGKYIFLTREEAEKALAERREG